MTLEELLRAIFPPHDGDERPSPAQRAIVAHPSGPAWVIAGPGSGKTETLALLVLRLLYVDLVEAESIVVTTFTEKAALNLDDRISLYSAAFVNAHPELRTVDVSRLRIGTLHSLCNDLLQEFRAPNYQNVRLMDEFETAMFVHQHVEFTKRNALPERLGFWRHFAYLFRPYDWKPEYDKTPRRWVATRALVTLLNRIVDDRASLDLMRAEGGAWSMLADVYEQYAQKLRDRNRCDFAHLLARFLDFLGSPGGAELREGTAERPPIRWVLVDEYQDTNVLQERIYLTLAGGTDNIVVVGDDDQALYRFRGASVECMVTFDEACAAQLGIDRESVAKYTLIENFRSHQKIVDFCNAYVTAFNSMHQPGSRVPGKPSLEPRNVEISSHEYLAVGTISAITDPNAAVVPWEREIADLVQNARDAYHATAVTHPELGAYVERAVRNIGENSGQWVPTELQELVYLLLALEPFNGWNESDASRRERLAKITALVEAFASLPVAANDRARRGSMKAAPVGQRGVIGDW